MGTYLGQNFLKDAKVREYIADKVKNLYKKYNYGSLLEIGPGKGAITKKIKDISPNFFVFEKDTSLIPYLKDNIGLLEKQIIIGDILDQDISSLNIQVDKTMIVGNLPYYITSPILRKLFAEDYTFPIGIFMIQDEVGHKIKTDASKKSYLWWLINYYNTVTYLKMVPAKSFKPAPKVKSCLILIQKKEKQDISISFEHLIQILNLISRYSRKTLGRIEKLISKNNGDKIQVPEHLRTKRLEDLSYKDISEIKITYSTLA